MKPKLTEQHKQDHFQWAHVHVSWIKRQWQNVLFSDKASFDFDISDNRIKNEWFQPQMILKKQTGVNGSVKIWGGIFENVKTPLIWPYRRVTDDVTLETFLWVVQSTDLNLNVLIKMLVFILNTGLFIFCLIFTIVHFWLIGFKLIQTLCYLIQIKNKTWY